MKRIIYFCLFLTIYFIHSPSIFNVQNYNITHAETAPTYGYYKALSACVLFKTSDITNMNIENTYFIIPEGYFVKKVSEISPTTLKVSYNNKTGYVMQERVRSVSFLPENKVLNNITFDISSMSGTQLWLKPSSQNQSDIIVKLIPAGTKNLTYIAEAKGEIPQGATSSTWYYCYYSPSSEPTSVYEGYIHSEKATNLSPIVKNTEDDIVINDSITSNHKTLELSQTVQIILIALITLPLLIIIVIIFLGSRRKTKIEEYEKSNIIDEPSDENIIRDKSKLKDIDRFTNKKFSLKKSFENFMYDEDYIAHKNNNKKSQISFQFSDDEDELL